MRNNFLPDVNYFLFLIQMMNVGYKSYFFTSCLIVLFILIFANDIIAQKTENKNEQSISVLIKQATKYKSNNGLKAIESIEKALQQQDEITNAGLLAELYGSAGQIFFSQEIYDQSLQYFNRQYEVMKKSNPEKLYMPLTGIGNIYNSLNNIPKAKSYYQEALSEIKKNSKNKPDSLLYIINNNLAIIEQNQGNFRKALDIYNESKNISYRLKDTLGLIMSYQNIGLVNFEMNDYESGFKNTFEAEKLAKAKKSWYDLSQINYNIGYAYKNLIKDNKLAKEYFLKSFEISKDHQISLTKKLASEELSQLYESQADYKQSNYYLRIAKSLNEEKLKKQSKDEISILELKYQQKLKEEALIENQKKKNLLFWTGIIILLLISSILILLYKLQRTKLKNRASENQLLISQLEIKNKEITEQNLKMIQASGILDNTSKKLMEVKESSSLKTKQLISQIISDLKTGPGRFNHSEFEKIFKETHEDFYKKLLSDFPDLTRNEIRLCAFLKMNLSTKEISAITQQSYNSITIARYRLRKKLGLEENQSLTNFLLSL